MSGVRPEPARPAPPRTRPVQPAGHPHAFALSLLLTLRPGGGQRLPAAVQRKMEDFFGARFDDVRIHAGGSEAASIGALAFTNGSAIYFAPGQYNPSTPYGQRLLGHELTHVLQQRAGRVRSPFGERLAVVQDPLLEAEAERKGALAALHREPFPASSRPVQAKPAAGGTLPVRLPVPPPAPRTAQLKAALLARPPARPTLSQPVIQRTITQSVAFQNDRKVQKAFRPFQDLLRGDKELRVLHTNPDLNVHFDIGNSSQHRASTVISGVYSGASFKMSQYESKLLGGVLVKPTGGLGFEQIQIDVTLMAPFIQVSDPPLIVKTLSHEVGAHVAPYLGALAKMLAGQRLTKKQKQLIAADASGGGRHDHAQIRSRSNLHYERLVRRMAKSYGAGTKPGRMLVEGYLDDISRYDERGDPLNGGNRYNWFGRSIEHEHKRQSWRDATWTQSYLDEPSLPWTRPQKRALKLAGLTTGLGVAWWTGALNVAANSAFDLAAWSLSGETLSLT